MSDLADISKGLDEILGSLDVIQRDSSKLKLQSDSLRSKLELLNTTLSSDAGLQNQLCSTHNLSRQAHLIIVERVFDVQILLASEELSDRFSLGDLRATFLKKAQALLPTAKIKDVVISLSTNRVGVSKRRYPFGWDTMEMTISGNDEAGSTILLIRIGLSLAVGELAMRFQRIGPPIIAGALDLPLSLRVRLVQDFISEIDANIPPAVEVKIPNPLSASGEHLSFIAAVAADDALSLYSSLLGPDKNRTRRYSRLQIGFEQFYATIEVLDPVWEWFAQQKADAFTKAFAEMVRKAVPDFYFDIKDLNVTLNKQPFFWGGKGYIEIAFSLKLQSAFCNHELKADRMIFEIRRYGDQEYHNSIKLGLYCAFLQGASVKTEGRGDIVSPTCKPEHKFLKNNFLDRTFDEIIIVNVQIEGAAKISHWGWPVYGVSSRLSFQLVKAYKSKQRDDRCLAPLVE